MLTVNPNILILEFYKFLVVYYAENNEHIFQSSFPINSVYSLRWNETMGIYRHKFPISEGVNTRKYLWLTLTA